MRSERIESDRKFYQKMISNKRIYTENKSCYQIKKDVGTGELMIYSVMNGIEIIYSQLKMKTLFDSTIHIGRLCLEITYCFEGNIEVEFKNHRVSHIQAGDISLFNCQTEIKYCDFGERTFKGFSIILYPKEAINSLNSFLETNEIKEEDFLNYVWETEACLIYQANIRVEHLCQEIMFLHEKYKSYHLKLKITELLLYLLEESMHSSGQPKYFSKSTIERTKNIRRFLVEHPERKITIEKIAFLENIEKNKLQKCFKEIYGCTISQYRRKIRIQRGKELLLQTKMSVTEIAGSCGYENMSKFSAAFFNEYGMTPKQFRNHYEA